MKETRNAFQDFSGLCAFAPLRELLKTSRKGAKAQKSCLLFAFLVLCLARGAAGAQTPRPTPDPTLPSLFVVGDSTANNNANGGKG